jgi:glucosamine--fructose-6-phosphate aminotransferase (isomerizing)
MTALGRRLRELDPPFVLTCGRGSSDHAATFAKYLIETRAKVPVASYAPSVSSVHAASWRKLHGSLFLAVSQSGRSPDLVASAEAARGSGALVGSLVNDASSPLAAASDVVVPLLAGTEQSVAATKSYIASLMSFLQLTAAWTETDDLLAAAAAGPAALDTALRCDWSAMIEPLSSARGAFIIGRSYTFGVAQEIALKLKETSGIQAEAFSAAEVRHGPMAIVEEGFPVLMLQPAGPAGETFAALAKEFAGRGARVLIAGASHPNAVALPTVPDVHPALAPAAMVLSFYRAVAALSLARGRDPDRPPHLSKVTETV